jgi:phosphoribosylformimino-5-aminoimidazole carboxamide ribotide isomerase
VRCIFVLDIFNGAVVHAVRGNRNRYEPIERFSSVVATSDPLQILREIRPKEVYVADLNLLTNKGDNLAAIKEISTQTKTMADTGVSNFSDLERLPKGATPILGTETASFRLIEKAASRREIVASIDLKSRKVLTRDPMLSEESPLAILQLLNGLPLEAVILLELDRVGTSCGLDEGFLGKAVATSDHPLILGGGVRDLEDLYILNSLGFSGALVATAVHNRSIPAEILR